ncbi:protein kinase 2B, chloroplastic-like [Gossypium australe]|uniref:Protein kinase 2B, chloroplastic-like n=1 Tax=Gossypium australe TaxID=47621 RepID=A0A5B6VLC4_9ROSI|nr:protein kinase 2B, chloroplastic-like [Gossypium australe]
MLKVGDEEVTLQKSDVMRVSSEQDDTFYFVNSIDHVAQHSLQEITYEDILELCPVQGNIESSMIIVNSFKIKIATIQMTYNTLQFKGNMAEDLNQQLMWFLQLYGTFKYNGVSDNAV